MTYDPHNARSIPAGTPVVALNGERLGTVREAYPHYVLVDQAEQHLDVNVPVHAIEGIVDGALRLTVNREALTEVDHEESVHRVRDDAPDPER